MHDVHRRAGHLGERDDAVRRLRLGQRRPRQRVLRAARASRRHGTLLQHLDDAAVLGVDHHRAAVRGRAEQGAEDASRRPPSGGRGTP